MSKLSTREVRRKAGAVETAPEYRGPDTSPPPAHLRRKPETGDRHGYVLSRLEQLLDEDPPMCVVKVWRHLDRKGRWTNDRGSWTRCVWENTRTIAKATGLSESAVRYVALPWLADRGWVAKDWCTIDGVPFQVQWCLWILPLDPAGQEYPLGMGQVLDGDHLEIEPIEARKVRKKRARKSANRADACAHSDAPDYRGEREEKTTDRPGPSSSSDSLRSGEEIPDAPPAPPLDPRIAGAIGPDDPITPAELEDLAVQVPDWMARHSAEWVVKAIRLAMATRKKKTIGHLRKYLGKILANWARDGEPSGCPEASSPLPSLTNQPSQAEVDDRAEARRRVIESERRLAWLKAAWAALPDDDRASIEAAYDRDHPPVEGMPPRIAKSIRDLGLLDRLAIKIGA